MGGGRSLSLCKEGNKYNKLTIISSAGTILVSGRRNSLVLCRCDCGVFKILLLTKVVNGHTKSCGCLLKHPQKRDYFPLLDKKEKKLYYLWLNIKQRCYNPNSSSFKRYGGMGIKMQEDWIYNPITFITYCKTLQGHNDNSLSIDRIDPYGDYVEGNLRFADKHIQSTNRRYWHRNKTGYIGITFIPLVDGNNKFRARICINGMTINLGMYYTAKEAALARNNYIIKNNLTEYKTQEL